MIKRINFIMLAASILMSVQRVLAGKVPLDEKSNSDRSMVLRSRALRTEKPSVPAQINVEAIPGGIDWAAQEYFKSDDISDCPRVCAAFMCCLTIPAIWCARLQ